MPVVCDLDGSHEVEHFLELRSLKKDTGVVLAWQSDVCFPILLAPEVVSNEFEICTEEPFARVGY